MAEIFFMALDIWKLLGYPFGLA